MGSWCAGFLRDAGFDVTIFGRDPLSAKKIAERLKVNSAPLPLAITNADLVIVSVPIGSFENAVVRVSPYITSRQAVVDVTSVKTMPVSVMHKYLPQIPVLGTHPLFGPGATDLNHQNIVLTPTNEIERNLADKYGDFLAGKGANIIRMDPGKHDEMMSVVLGLSHFIALVSADALAKFGNFNEFKAISGVTYKALLTLIESVVSEDPALYSAIQMNLPGLPAVERQFLGSTEKWANMVDAKDGDRFIRTMSDLKTYYENNDPDFGKAYQNLYRLMGGS